MPPDGARYADLAPMGAAEGDPTTASGRVFLRERPFLNGLLLTIITLGIYRYYWHYVTHDELCRQVGRGNQEKGLLVGWVAMDVLGLVLSVYILFRTFGTVFRDYPTEAAAEEALRPLLFSLIGLFIIGIILWVIATILFIMYVAKQYQMLRATRHAWSLHAKTGPEWFFGFYYGSLVLGVPLIGLPVAYYNLQEHYNELYRRAVGSPVGSAHSQQTYAPPPSYRPPPTAPAQNQPQRPTWDPGYRIGDRAAPSASRIVEQTFQCPRCHGHVTAQGPAGADVQIRCGQCGEGGHVTLAA